MTEYDTEQRDRARLILLNYMKQHGIGVPRLARRITAALPRRPDIPVKTLQRFLAGKMRTNDMQADYYVHFAELNSKENEGRLNLGRALQLFVGRDREKNWEGPYVGREYAPSEDRNGTPTMFGAARENGVWCVKEAYGDIADKLVF